jgi:hypothetical protein
MHPSGKPEGLRYRHPSGKPEGLRYRHPSGRPEGLHYMRGRHDVGILHLTLISRSRAER